MPSDAPSIDPAVDAALLPTLIAPGRTALLVIDVQEDFCAPQGAAGRWGVDLGRFEAPLGRIQALIGAARAASATIVFVRVISSPETDSTALRALHAAKGRPPAALAVCRAGTPGARYYQVGPEPGDLEIEKRLYSSFAGTDLDTQLRGRGIDTLLVTGFTTECCVDSTVRDAFHRDYHCVLVADACAAYEPALHDGALAALSKNCALLTETGDVLAAWQADVRGS